MKTRTDLRCPVDRHHVVCKVTERGPVCTLCGTLITKEEIERQEARLREVKHAKRP
jgi:hypothetical protein